MCEKVASRGDSANPPAGIRASAQNLTAPGAIDVLYAVGFLGVRRGNDVVYAGRTQPPSGGARPNSTSIPASGHALTGTNAAELPAYRPQAWISLLREAAVESPSHPDRPHGAGEDSLARGHRREQLRSDAALAGLRRRFLR